MSRVIVRTYGLALGAALGSLGFAQGHTQAVDASVADPPAESEGHAEVISQGVVDLVDGDYQWQLGTRDVGAADGPIDVAAPAFLYLRGGEVLVTGSDGARSLLGPGEATFRQPGSSSTAREISGTPTSLMETTLGPPTEYGASPAFTPGAGSHDVELVRGTVAPGDVLTLTSGNPALVLAVEGGAVIVGDGTTLAEGGTAAPSGTFSLSTPGDQSIVVLVALVGPVIGDDVADGGVVATSEPSEESPSNTAAPEVTSPPADPSPTAPPTSASPTTAPPVTEPPPTVPPSTDATSTEPPTTPPPADSDGDGLTDQEEAGIGSDPYNPNTDGDARNDYQEIIAGTNPLIPD